MSGSSSAASSLQHCTRSNGLHFSLDCFLVVIYGCNQACHDGILCTIVYLHIYIYIYIYIYTLRILFQNAEIVGSFACTFLPTPTRRNKEGSQHRLFSSNAVSQTNR